MRRWSAREAQVRFNAMLDACTAQGPQLITRRGIESAVLVPIDEWRRLQATAQPSLKQLLLAEMPRVELELPPRGRRAGRKRRSSRDDVRVG